MSTYYVAKTGSSDSYPGTLAQPFLTIQKGLNVARAGDFVFVKVGTYAEYVTFGYSGTVGNPITLLNYGTDVVTVDGVSTRVYCIYASDKSYITIKGIIAKDSTNYNILFSGCRNIIFENVASTLALASSAINIIADSTVTNRGSNIIYQDVSTYGGQIGLWIKQKIDNITITRGEYSYAVLDGINLVGESVASSMNYATNVTIDGSNIHHNGRQGVISWCTNGITLRNFWSHHNDASGVQIENYSSNVLVEDFLCEYNCLNNTFETGLWIDDTDTAIARRGIMRYNQTGFRVSGSRNVLAYDLLIYENRNGFADGMINTSGINFYSNPSTDQYPSLYLCDVRMYNCTLYNNSYSSSQRGSITLQGEGNYTIKNCIISNDQSTLDIFRMGTHTLVSDYNLYYNTRALSIYNLTTTQTYSAYKSATGLEVHSVNSNPLFISSTDYQLQSTSPAINVGVNVGLTTDYLNNPIIGLPDIGAYEYQSGVTTTTTTTISPTTTTTTSHSTTTTTTTFHSTTTTTSTTRTPTTTTTSTTRTPTITTSTTRPPTTTTTSTTRPPTTTTTTTTNASPTVVLNSPIDGFSDTNTTPTLNFTGTDIEGNALEYNVQVDTTSTFTGIINLSDSYNESNYDTNAPMYNGNDTHFAQSFHGVDAYLYSTKFYLLKTGSPTGNLYARLWSHSGTYGINGVPTGIALVTSDSIDVTTISTSGFALKEFLFTGANQYHMVSGTNYFISIEFTGGNASNFITLGIDGTSPTHSGNFAYGTTSWSPAIGIYDICFYLYTSQNIPLIDVLSTINIGFTIGHPFTSGVAKNYTIQSALSAPTTYYWRVRAIDPTGSNTYGPWSSIRSFNLDSPTTTSTTSTISTTSSPTTTTTTTGELTTTTTTSLTSTSSTTSTTTTIAPTTSTTSTSTTSTTHTTSTTTTLPPTTTTTTTCIPSAIDDITQNKPSGVPFSVVPINGIDGLVSPNTKYTWILPNTYSVDITGGQASVGLQLSINGTLSNNTSSPAWVTYSVTAYNCGGPVSYFLVNLLISSGVVITTTTSTTKIITTTTTTTRSPFTTTTSTTKKITTTTTSSTQRITTTTSTTTTIRAIYRNIAMSVSVSRNNCPIGYSTISILYIVPSNKYSSYISQKDANNKAILDLNRNKQAYANIYGVCIPRKFYYSIEMSRVATKDDCPDKYHGTEEIYTVHARKYRSTISQEDADNKALNDLNANTQIYVNNCGHCLEDCTECDQISILSIII